MKLGPNQKKWIKELPKYAKAEGSLCIKNKGFCCLGVAADIFSPEDWQFNSDDEGAYQSGHFLVSKTLIDDQGLVDKLRLRAGEGLFKHPVRCEGMAFYDLAQVNDTHPEAVDHEWMAKFIEDNADNIFEGPA